MREHILDHLKENNLLSEKQYGFVSGRSTTLQLLHFLESLHTSLDINIEVDVIYMDFMKAFDSVPHMRLVEKMKSLGITGKLIKWLTSFLTGRKQRVVVNKAHSNWKPVISGIPQGSVLGPIMFVMYINDLPEVTESEVYMYADDTKLMRPIKNKTDQEKLQTDLNNLQKWSRKWLLKFHPEKCKVLSFGSEDHERKKYYMDNNGQPLKLCTISKDKDVGVTIDSQLTFYSHIKEKINQSNRILGLIRSFRYMDQTTFSKLLRATPGICAGSLGSNVPNCK